MGKSIETGLRLRLPGAGGGTWEGTVQWVQAFSLEGKCSGTRRSWLHNTVNVLIATELLILKWVIWRASLVVQWLGLHIPIAGGAVLIPGRGTKIQHAVWYTPKKKKKFKWLVLCFMDLTSIKKRKLADKSASITEHMETSWS